MARLFLQFVQDRSSLTPRPRHGESGQVLMLSVLLLPILLGMCAMAVDLGSYAAHRRQLQNTADAVALAASQDLPNASAATASAQAWAAKNGINWSDVTVVVTPVGPGNPNPKVSVDISRTHFFSFMRALGVSSRDVSAHAAAVKTSPQGLGNLVPWSVRQTVVTSSTSGSLLTIKYDATNSSNGNFGALALDGTGASVYQDSAKNGSSSFVCANGVPSCTTNSPGCSASVCSTESGNMTGPTRNSVDYRIANTDPSCSTFAQVFNGPTSGRYGFNSQCNPWIAGSKSSLRVIIVPVTGSLCNGRCDETILGFALFFLEGYGSGGCTGNNCEVQGRFIDSDVTMGATMGVYDPNSNLHFTRLTE